MQTPSWLNNANFYQIFPDRFARIEQKSCRPLEPWQTAPTRDNFLGGNFPGIISKLDYLADMGFNALYVNPIFAAATNHRYDAEDYFKIDPLLGTLEDFQNFIKEAHKRGIKVVLDAVLNHCGKTHWMFQDVIKNEEKSEFVNYFSIKNFPVKSFPEPNYKTCSGCEYLPKWNVFNPKVREHHFEVARYWINQGIDGWRLDVPYFIYHEFWQEFCALVKKENSELCLIAEEWRDPAEWLQGDMCDSTMNYTLRNLILSFTADRSINAVELADGLNRLQQRIPYGYHHGMLNLLGSHDTARVLTLHKGDMIACMNAFSLLYACEGAPMVYYGDELGMSGDNDPGCRAGMEWEKLDNQPELMQMIKSYNQGRSDHSVWRKGTQSVYYLDSDTIAIKRSLSREALIFVINRAGTAKLNKFDLSRLTNLSNVAILQGISTKDDYRSAQAGKALILQVTDAQ